MRILKPNHKYLPKQLVAYFPTWYEYKIDKWSLLRDLAKKYPPVVSTRLEWIIFYHTVGKKDASYTARYFNISRKTFHKWNRLFEESKDSLDSLRDRSRRPQRLRTWQVSVEEEDIVYTLRKRHMRYGKKKLKRLCLREYGLSISTWKIERVIRKHRLYIDPIKQRKIEVKRAKGKANPRIRVHSLPKPESIGALWHIDSIILNIAGVRRAIVTGIDELSKIAYARMYASNTSSNTKDFVNRLLYLTEGQVSVLHTDNGSEFDGQFAEVVKELNIARVYSRPHTPKDNPVNERFNRTIQEEWLDGSDIDVSDIKDTNKSLTQWLIEYNTYRPHESLDQLTPLEYVEANIKVLPMYPACTHYCKTLSIV